MPDLEKPKETFLALCREKIHREGLEDLLAWLTKSDFFTAPASTRFTVPMTAACASIPWMCTRWH